jgi:hypothetical protein
VIGKLFLLGATEPFRHPKVWKRETVDGRERLAIGAGLETLTLVRALAWELKEPLSVLVVMRVPRVAEAPGRWESEPYNHAALERFLDRFGELFEDDGRADLWIGETQGDGLLVLDEHDVVYAYGPVQRIQTILNRRGYARGAPTVPVPHEHRYHRHFDDLERQLEHWAWRRVLPLEDVEES